MGGECVAVTGGSGYVGLNLVPELLARGDHVRVVDPRLHPLLAGTGVEHVPADVRDAGSVAAALQDVDVVYHLAAVISVVGDMGGLVTDVNVGGSATVAAQARRAGVARLVYCGSVHGYDTEVPGPINEDGPRSTRPEQPAYDRSKAAAEVAIREQVAAGLDAVLLNPTGIIGPRDPGPSRTGQVLQAMRRGRLPAVIDGGFDWIDVRDVARGLLAARERGRSGENYLLAGHRLSLRELAEVVSEVSGARAPRFTLPMWFARLWSPVATPFAKHTGSALLYTGEALRALEAFPVVDDRKARRELGHTPRPIAETMRDLFAWFDSAEFRSLAAAGGS